MRVILYKAIPELQDRIKRALTLRNNSLRSDMGDGVHSVKSKRKVSFNRQETSHKTINGIHLEHVPSHPDHGGSTPHTANRVEANTNSEHDDELKSVDSVKAKKAQEVDQILKYFNGDTSQIQDVVIKEFKYQNNLYLDNRFQLLSLNSLLNFKKDLIKEYEEILQKAKEKDESHLVERMEKEKIVQPEIDLVQVYEKQDIENKFAAWKISSSIEIFIDLNVQTSWLGGLYHKLSHATGLPKRVVELSKEIDEICAKNSEFFEFDEETKTSLKQEFKDLQINTIERELLFDWMLPQESFFMCFSNKNELAQLVENLKGQQENAVLRAVETTWDSYNDFLDKNLQLLLRTLKDLSILSDRTRESLYSTRNQLNGTGQPKAKRNNGVIYHDFDINGYIEKLFAEDEQMVEDLQMVQSEPSALEQGAQSTAAGTEKKVEPQVVAPPLQQQNTEMDKMRTVLIRAVTNHDVSVQGSDFRNQFGDLMKNINQSYTLLKGSVVGDKKKGEEDSAHTETRADSTVGLFKKIKVRKEQPKPSASKHSEYKPDLILAPLKEDLAGRGRNRRTSEFATRSRVSREHSFSQERSRTRDILESLPRRHHTSLENRARRRIHEPVDSSLSSLEVRRPNLSSILLNDNFNLSAFKSQIN